MKVKLIPVEGEIKEVELGKDQFAEIQKLVGGYVVRYPRTNIIVDEDGLPKGLPINPRASEKVGGPVVGNAVEFLNDKDRAKLFGR